MCNVTFINVISKVFISNVFISIVVVSLKQFEYQNFSALKVSLRNMGYWLRFNKMFHNFCSDTE